ncbi:MAG: hypothetical protein HYX51_07915 [Chloroflexi bacterium]|nr:hypothetical protein [Chloroflexota bacterium]
MATEILVDRHIDDGRLLIQEVEQDTPVSSAFWLRDPETRKWELVIAFPIADSEGRLPLYEKIQSALKRLDGKVRLSLLDIHAVRARSPEVQSAKNWLGLDRPSARGRKRNGLTQEVSLDDLYVYRLK